MASGDASERPSITRSLLAVLGRLRWKGPSCVLPHLLAALLLLACVSLVAVRHVALPRADVCAHAHGDLAAAAASLRADLAAAALASDEAPRATALLISLVFNEDSAWFGFWVAATARRLAGLPFLVAISTRSMGLVDELRELVEAAGLGHLVVFSEPFYKHPTGPFLLEGHVRNLELALAQHYNFSHALFLASNCMWVRNVSAELLVAFAAVHPVIYDAELGPSWYWNPFVWADDCLWHWMRLIDAAVLCRAGETCVLGAGPVKGVHEGTIATRAALRPLLILIRSYLALATDVRPSFGRIDATVTASDRGAGARYPGEEVVLFSAAAILAARAPPGPQLFSSGAVRVAFASTYEPTEAEIRAEKADPQGALLVKRVPRMVGHALVRAAVED